MDFIPERSAIQISNISFRDPIVKEMINELDLKAFVAPFRPKGGNKKND